MLPCSEEAGVYRVKRNPNKSQPRASRLGRKVLHELNQDCEITGKQGVAVKNGVLPLEILEERLLSFSLMVT